MPNLSHFTFRGNDTMSIVSQLALLNHIDSPRTVQLNLYNLDNLSARELAFMWTVLGQKARSIFSPNHLLLPLHSTCQFGGAGDEWTFIYFDRTITPLQVLRGDSACLIPESDSGTFSLLSSYVKVDSLLESLFQSPFPLSSISQLKLVGVDLSRGVSGLRLILRTFSNLEELFVGQLSNHSRVLEALDYLLGQSLGSTTESYDVACCVLPRLTTMQFTDANWCRHVNRFSRPNGLPPVPTHCSEPLAEQLTRVLAKWSAQTRDGRVLDTFIISTPRLLGKDVLAAIAASGTVKSVVHDFDDDPSSTGRCGPCSNKNRDMALAAQGYLAWR